MRKHSSPSLYQPTKFLQLLQTLESLFTVLSVVSYAGCLAAYLLILIDGCLLVTGRCVGQWRSAGLCPSPSSESLLAAGV